ncbi:hypothetical protein AB4254_12105 [Vibrio breoganii]
MKELEPTRVVLTCATPIVLTEFAPQFDALIYEALTQATDLSHEDILLKMKSMLQFNEQFGVFHASSMRFVIKPEEGLTTSIYCRTDSHRDLFFSQNYLPNGVGGRRYSGVMTAGGAYKSRLNERLAYKSPFVAFDTVCNPVVIKNVLLNSFVGVGYDAFSVGMGEITNVTTIALEDDVSISFNKQARRNIPVGAISECESERTQSPLVPPYFSKEGLVECYSASRVSIISAQNIGKAI